MSLQRLDGALLCTRSPYSNATELRAHWMEDGSLALVNWFYYEEDNHRWHHQLRRVPEAGVRLLYSVLKAKVEGSGVLLGDPA